MDYGTTISISEHIDDTCYASKWVETYEVLYVCIDISKFMVCLTNDELSGCSITWPHSKSRLL